MGHSCGRCSTRMAFSFPLPPPLDTQGWKLKIRDRERSEPPHVTILHKRRAWRVNLRTGRVLDSEPDPRDVPREVWDHIFNNADLLREKWDELYPENPIDSQEDTDE
jgi:hypothetical protein